MELFVNRPRRKIQTARSYQAATESLTVSRNETIYLKVGFMADNTTTLDDPNTAPAITNVRLTCKNSTSDQGYDENPLVDYMSFTRTLVGSEYFMIGSVPFTSGGLDKLLGIDDSSAYEVTAVQCVADSSGSLRTKSFRIPTGAATWDRIWFQVGGTGTAPTAATGETLKMAVISANATATQVATSLVTLYTGSVVFTVTSVSDTATFTDLAQAARGNPAALDSTFVISTVTAGKTAFAVTDVASVDLNAWLSYYEGGVLQVLPMFTITVENNGIRPGTPSAIYGGGSRTQTTTIGNGDSTVAVTFATAFPHATYKIASCEVVNTTDGSPLGISVQTITARSTTGFTVALSCATDSANYTLDTIALIS